MALQSSNVARFALASFVPLTLSWTTGCVPVLPGMTVNTHSAVLASAKPMKNPASTKTLDPAPSYGGMSMSVYEPDKVCFDATFQSSPGEATAASYTLASYVNAKESRPLRRSTAPALVTVLAHDSRNDYTPGHETGGAYNRRWEPGKSVIVHATKARICFSEPSVIDADAAFLVVDQKVAAGGDGVPVEPVEIAAWRLVP